MKEHIRQAKKHGKSLARVELVIRLLTLAIIAAFIVGLYSLATMLLHEAPRLDPITKDTHDVSFESTP